MAKTLRGLRLIRLTGQSRTYRKLKIPKDVLKHGIIDFLRPLQPVEATRETPAANQCR